MDNGRIIIRATLMNCSALSIGSGRDDHSDKDIMMTEYRVDPGNHQLIPGPGNGKEKIIELPFIPATSFLGRINALLHNKDKDFMTYWGKTDDESNASGIDCDDIYLIKLPNEVMTSSGAGIEIRDGIRIDPLMGIVAHGAKFDFEALAPGAKFDLTLILRADSKNSSSGVKQSNYLVARDIANAIASIINEGFNLGSKSAVGLGKMKGDAKIFELDFSNKNDFNKWLENDLENNPSPIGKSKYLYSKMQHFEIQANFRIKNSLIIRSYSADPKMPDATHLKSGGKNIISGISLKGALLSRARRILNTVQSDRDVTETIIAGLFGDVEKENHSSKVKKNGFTIPSRISVDEIFIDPATVKEELQTRIQIDRFTGGTVNGALIEEVPIFPIADLDQIKNFTIRVTDPQPLDKGLLLLLLKDLWTADLPVGGEKAIGRGVLEGVEATIKDKEKTYHLPQAFEEPGVIADLQSYITSIKVASEYNYYKARVEKFNKA